MVDDGTYDLLLYAIVEIPANELPAIGASEPFSRSFSRSAL